MKFFKRKDKLSVYETFAESPTAAHGKDLSTVTTRLTKDKKSLLPRTRSSASSVTSNTRSIKSDKIEILDFAISLEAIDGIISTRTRRSTQPHVPVFAVASYSQELRDTNDVVKSNIPSMPLMKSTSSIGNRERYHAAFGYPDGPVNAPEVIHLGLPMRIDNRSLAGYEARQMDITISIMRGSEVLRLGVACLSLEGDETNESKLISVGQDKTVKTTRRNGKKSVTSTTKTTTVGARSSAFNQDPSQRYSLQRANIRVSIECKRRGMDPTTSATSRYLRDKEPKNPPPITDLISIGHSTSTVSVITSADSEDMTKDRYTSSAFANSKSRETTRQVYASSSNIDYIKREDSLLSHVSLNLSKSDSFGIDTIDEGITVDSDDKSKEYFGFFPFGGEGAETEGGTTDTTSFSRAIPNVENTWSNDESTLLDDVSLGTIKFKEATVYLCNQRAIP